MASYRTLGVIPARYASTRFPGKALALLCGKPIVEWVWRQAKKARLLDDVWIATDDERIAAAARSFGAKAVMTSPDCPSGSDRIAEAARDVEVELIANIQGDEPLISPRTIDRAVQALLDDPSASVSTPRAPIGSREEFENPNVVKVVTDRRGRALYFSRSPIPSLARAAVSDSAAAPPNVFKHPGFYVYRKAALLEFGGWPPTALEKIEKL